MRFRTFSLIEFRVQPTRLKEAREIVFTKFEKFVNGNESLDQKWPRIYLKIQQRGKLRLRELKFSIFKTDVLNEEECKFLLETVLRDFKDPSIISNLFSNVVNLMRPWKSLKLALDLDRELSSKIKNIEFFFKFKNLIQSSNSIEDFTSQYFREVRSVIELKEFMRTSEIVNKLTLSYTRENTFDEIFLSETNELLDFLYEKINADGFLHLIDRYVGNFILQNSNWSSQLLDKNYPLNKLIVFVVNKKIPFSNYGERLKNVYDKYVLSLDFINELRALSKERADYWEYKIKNFDGVDIRRFGNSKFGMAMYLKNYVVVEFAPLGNALYFYKKNIFSEKVRDSSNWSNKDLAGIDIGQGSFSLNKELRDLRNGNFTHSKNWMSRMDKILVVITNV